MTFYLMIAVSLFVLISGGMLVFYRVRDGEWDTDDFVPITIFGLVLGAVGGAVVWLGLSIIFANTADTEYYVYKEREIQGLKDNQVTNGAFVLGSGVIKGEMKYYYMYRSGEGYLMGSAYADSAVLVEGDSKPRIVIKRSRFKSAFWRKNLGDALEEDKITIYVPKKTIKVNYDVDMEGK